MPNYTVNIGLFVGRRQSPICTGYPVTLVLVCSVTPFNCIPYTKHRHCFSSSLFRLAISGMRSPYLPSRDYIGTRDKIGRFFQLEGQKGIFKWVQMLLNAWSGYRFTMGENRSSSFLNSTMRSRIIAAFSNSRFLAAAFI
jgi:hypothetical protein